MLKYNRNPIEIGYKVVNKDLKSAVISTKGIARQYSIEHWTHSPHKQLPLMVFSSLAHARFFVTNLIK